MGENLVRAYVVDFWDTDGIYLVWGEKCTARYKDKPSLRWVRKGKKTISAPSRWFTDLEEALERVAVLRESKRTSLLKKLDSINNEVKVVENDYIPRQSDSIAGRTGLPSIHNF